MKILHGIISGLVVYLGCNPDIKNAYGDTSLHTAARYGHAGVSRILISAKANVNEQVQYNPGPTTTDITIFPL